MNLLVIKNHSLTFGGGGGHDSQTCDQFDHVSTVKINPIKVREKMVYYYLYFHPFQKFFVKPQQCTSFDRLVFHHGFCQFQLLSS